MSSSHRGVFPLGKSKHVMWSICHLVSLCYVLSLSLLCLLTPCRSIFRAWYEPTKWRKQIFFLSLTTTTNGADSAKDWIRGLPTQKSPTFSPCTANQTRPPDQSGESRRPRRRNTHPEKHATLLTYPVDPGFCRVAWVSPKHLRSSFLQVSQGC